MVLIYWPVIHLGSAPPPAAAACVVQMFSSASDGGFSSFFEPKLCFFLLTQDKVEKNRS